MLPQRGTSQSFERPRQYGPDPASAAAAYHIDDQNAQLSSRHLRQDTTITSRRASSHHWPSNNNPPGSGGRNTSHVWFDEANAAIREPQLSTEGKTQFFNPPLPADRHTRSGEPPFHPRGSSSSDISISSETNVLLRQAPDRTVANFARHGDGAPPEVTDSGLYRDIIDDLTVENRELKERVKRLEASMLRPAEVQQDQLFEVKVHGLPAHRKRQLVETLKTFAQEIDLQDNQTSLHSAAGSSTPYISVNRSVQAQRGMAKSPSDERPPSTYASASASGKVSIPALGQKTTGAEKLPRKQVVEPLPGTPAGLLYKGYDPSMTDREKKITVVKRLENMFSGKGGRHSRSTKTEPLLEGEANVEHIMDRMREAQILPSIEDTDIHAAGQLEETLLDSHNGSQHEADHEQPEAQLLNSPQRETRPLDVDPDRVQNPQENIKYIRHLGMSMSPKLSGDEPANPGPIHGWVYLNILFNLAQLHIFNVTPDFVRSAITEISTRFELSEDRQMVRWHSGPTDLKVSSDSEGDRAGRDVATDSSESSSKRQKLGDSTDTEDTSRPPHHGHSSTATSFSQRVTARARRRHDLEYKPLFAKPSYSASHPHFLDDTSSGYFHRSTIDGDAYSSIPGTMVTHATNISHPRSDSGPIVFFSGAHFVTDLSGDAQDTNVQDQPRYYNHEMRKSSITPLGAGRLKRPRQKPMRTDSGSRIRGRPFKDYSKCAESLQLEGRYKTPERICSDDANSNDIAFDPQWTEDGKSASPQPRIMMEASGIGGTRPDDNFVVIVETAHPKMRSEFHKHLQAQLATALDPERRAAKLLHMIEEAKLDGAQFPRQYEAKQPEGAGQEGKRSPPVKITVLSKRELRLQPSETPPAAQMWDDESDSDDDSDVFMDSSDEGIQRLKISPAQTDIVALESESDDDNDHDNDDDESIDMMGVDRVRNPQEVAEREGTYERNLRMIGAGETDKKKSASSNATAGDEEGETSDAEDEDEEGDDSGDEDEDASMKG